MITAAQNFENHMTQYATEKGFVWNSQQPLAKAAWSMFTVFSASYQQLMPYSVFKEQVIREGK